MSETKHAVRVQVDDVEGLSPAIVRRATGLSAIFRRNRAVQAARQASANDSGPIRSGGEGGPMAAQPRSIVVIDDEIEQLEMTVMLLQHHGHRVMASTNGAQAVAMATSARATVVVLDFMLNGMTGGDVCRALRAEPQTRDVRIVLLSGTPEADIRRSCTQYDIYVRKPTTSKALFQAVTRIA